MSVAEPPPLRVERLVAGGAGLARGSDGRVVFVEGALPGELVEVQVTKRARDYSNARAVAVLESSDARVTPPCEAVARGCGGCDWQHVSALAQGGLKMSVVTETMQRIGRIADPPVQLGPPVGPESARTTVRTTAAPDGRVGFRARRSHETVPISACLVAHPAVSDLLSRCRVPGGREVVIRVGARTGDRLVWAQPDGVPVAGVPGGVMIGADAYIDEVVAGVRLRVSAAAFFQPSPAGAEALVDAVRVLGGDELQSATLVADLYAGVGLFSACAVPPSGHVTAVEVSPVAAADARVNLSGRHASVIEAHVNSSIGVAADVVIADPPRAGLGAIGVAAVAATGASTILLVSCDPAAGARDIRLLCEGHGFCLESTWVVDQFPFTSHVEMVSRLVRA